MDDLDTFFEVCVAEPLVIDQEVFRAWIHGLAVEQVARHCQSKRTYPHLQPLQQQNIMWHVVRHCQDQYRSFELLQPFLCEPRFIGTQLKFQLPVAVQQAMVEMYYSFEDKVLRRFLGKKLTGKFKKDLEDVSERSGARIHSCRRQVENLRRLGNAVLNRKPPSVPAFIQETFHLSHNLAIRYSRIIFLGLNRIILTKKKLLSIPFNDCENIASALMSQFCTTGTVTAPGNEVSIDQRFADSLHDLKSAISERDISEHYRSLVVDDLRSQIGRDKLNRLDGRFSSILTRLLNMCNDVGQPKEFRDFVLDCWDKLSDQLIRCGFFRNDVDLFFRSLLNKFPALMLSAWQRERFGESWVRFITATHQCCMLVYERIRRS